MLTFTVTGYIDFNMTVEFDKVYANLLANPDEELTILIDSGGGIPESARHIYDRLIAVKNRTYTHVIGKCCSAANIILFGSLRRSCVATSKFMVHPTVQNDGLLLGVIKAVLVNTGGEFVPFTLKSIRYLIKELRKIHKDLLRTEKFTDDLLKSNTHMSRKQLTDRKIIDQWFDPATALKLNFISKII